MKIEQSNVTMKACHEFSSECEVNFEFESSFKSVLDGIAQTEETTDVGKKDEQARLLLMLDALIARILDFISGSNRAQVTDVQEILKTDAPPQPEQGDAPANRTSEMSWKGEFTETIREHESSNFSSTGEIKTADGRSLDFKLELSMCRDFSCERKIEDSGTIALRDPLIINFDGKAAELSGKRFSFDLDVDGKAESMFGLGSSSGYLAIDDNNDGRINDGSELFGTRSGNGFADLAKLDSDGNHWLDDADAGFNTLRVWQHDASGQSQLSSLRDKGVGALYLGSTDTPFTLTDKENRTLAQVRASGIYLMENGATGSLQQVDLAV